MTTTDTAQYGQSTLEAITIYKGSDGEATRAYYAKLARRGPIGMIAVCLFRAQKTSSRAKVYRGGNGNGSYRRQAYETKTWSIDQLTKILTEHGAALGFVWGWKHDEKVVFGDEPSWVIYVDLPAIGSPSVETGQVSFHSPTRGLGPEYVGAWDGSTESESRIIALCSQVAAMPEVSA